MFDKLKSNLTSNILGAVILVVGLSILVFDVVRVNEREVVVITRFGAVQSYKGAGWHLKTPLIDQVGARYNLAVNSVSTLADSATKDQQTLSIKVNVQYKLKGDRAEDIYKQVRNQTYLDESIIPPIIEEAVKASSAKYSLADLITNREQFKIDVINGLTERLDIYHADVVTVNIEDIAWSPEFEAAIQAKIKAEQETLQRQQELEKTKIEKEILITQAQAEAESLKIKGEAAKANPESVELEKIKKWDGKLPQVQGTEGVIISLD